MASPESHAQPGYPVTLNVSGIRCAVIGAGRVATRRIDGLVAAGASVRVVAPHPTPQVDDWARRGLIDLDRRAYRSSDLDGCSLVFAATDDRAVNRRVAQDARAAGTMANIADDPAESTFLVPAVLHRGSVNIAVTSGGAGPVLARRLRDHLGPFVGEEWGRAAQLLASTRSQLKARIPDPVARSGAVDRVLSTVLDDFAHGAAPGSEDVLAQVAHPPPTGTVALVGAGPGDPQLLTLRAATLIARADVIVHDRLGTEDILPLADATCELVDAGKAPGRHGMDQDAISAVLVERARRGLNVVRLKGGDPFVFGRGGEEAITLAEAGVDVEIVPGISSAIGGLSAAGIPATHRAVSQSLTIASGHDDPGSPAAAARWAALGAAPGTLVLLMAMTNLPAIAEALVDAGRSADEPVCAIQWATTPRERRVEASLGTIGAACRDEGLGNPALVVIGPVVEVGRAIAHALRRTGETATAPGQTSH